MKISTKRSPKNPTAYGTVEAIHRASFQIMCNFFLLTENLYRYREGVFEGVGRGKILPLYTLPPLVKFKLGNPLGQLEGRGCRRLNLSTASR